MIALTIFSYIINKPIRTILLIIAITIIMNLSIITEELHNR